MNISRVITFHFNPDKLGYLQRVVHEHANLQCTSKVDIITNTTDSLSLQQIRQSISSEISSLVQLELISVTPPHRWVLPWYSKLVLKQRRASNTFTHFMYTEDDILFSEVNRSYFIDNLTHLKGYGLYPSFLRIERRTDTNSWIASDLWLQFYKPPNAKDALPIPAGPKGHRYLNLSNPYQAMFFYDKDLYDEHSSCESFDINRYGNLHTLNDEWGGGVAERAALGLTYFRVPSFATSRNAIAFDPATSQIDSGAFVHHLPNNYASRSDVLSLDRLLGGSV